MIKLYEIGLNENDIKDMKNINLELSDITEEDLTEKINLLKSIGCQNVHISNIVLANPFYLTGDINVIKETINYITSLGFNPLWIIFDSNPYALSLTKLEIENHINTRLENNEFLDSIIDNLDETFFSEI